MSTNGSFSLLLVIPLCATRCNLKGILCRTHILKEGEKLSELRVITTHIMGVVEGTTKWYCGYCYEEFAVLKDLRNHTNNSHQGKKYRCDICMDFSSKQFDTIAGIYTVCWKRLYLHTNPTHLLCLLALKFNVAFFQFLHPFF